MGTHVRKAAQQGRQQPSAGSEPGWTAVAWWGMGSWARKVAAGLWDSGLVSYRGTEQRSKGIEGR